MAKGIVLLVLSFSVGFAVIHSCGTLSKSVPNDTDDAGVPARIGTTIKDNTCRLGHSC